MTGFELNPLKTYVNIKQPKLKKGVQDFLFFNIPLSIKSSTVLLGHIIKIHVHKSPRKAKFNHTKVLAPFAHSQSPKRDEYLPKHAKEKELAP